MRYAPRDEDLPLNHVVIVHGIVSAHVEGLSTDGERSTFVALTLEGAMHPDDGTEHRQTYMLELDRTAALVAAIMSAAHDAFGRENLAQAVWATLHDDAAERD